MTRKQGKILNQLLSQLSGIADELAPTLPLARTCPVPSTFQQWPWAVTELPGALVHLEGRDAFLFWVKKWNPQGEGQPCFSHFYLKNINCTGTLGKTRIPLQARNACQSPTQAHWHLKRVSLVTMDLTASKHTDLSKAIPLEGGSVMGINFLISNNIILKHVVSKAHMWKNISLKKH